MRLKVFNWLGREFVALSCEGRAGGSVEAETGELFERMEQELREHGLALDHTVRTRLWARDRESRDAGSRERLRVLSGRARSASSSYIAPGWFSSDARVGIDLLAMRPSAPDAEKRIQEYEPPITPVRYIVLDSVAFLSGVTSVRATLADQVPEILEAIGGSLRDAGTSWQRVERVSCFLHRSQALGGLRELLRTVVPAGVPRQEFSFVDGYSAPGKLVEIEVTAWV